jgi:hypothetical protein
MPSFSHVIDRIKAEDLYDKEKVDLETIFIDDVFKLLQCDENAQKIYYSESSALGSLMFNSVAASLDLPARLKYEQRLARCFLMYNLMGQLSAKDFIYGCRSHTYQTDWS